MCFSQAVFTSADPFVDCCQPLNDKSAAQAHISDAYIYKYNLAVFYLFMQCSQVALQGHVATV